ncbi:RNA polymerase sigma-70 region 4 domain-containing protein [Desulfonema limicola]|uniref:RNA polymerase sigma-70 region 4 domain-containing protein n=1 Tax=Desulfonema limicola TaxID=45656 RepID=A0A975B5A4_9BACT|nr:sigma factor-like helix-turn-helix DNA-binding protein [Desulfonema limicola]QTA79039.1 RNA polymerase sigma-70 region 4 domain-containing protein [Desulfonema limicola]
MISEPHPLHDRKFNNKNCRVLPFELFDTLLTSYDPCEIITEDVWQKWVVILTETTDLSLKLSGIASEIGLKWPAVRNNETFSDYTQYNLEQIKTLSGFGRKKIKTLLLCFAKVVYDAERLDKNNHYKTDSIPAPDNEKISFSEEDFFASLCNSNNPQQIISKDLWDEWKKRLVDTAEISPGIFDIANELGLTWAYSRRDEKVSDYAHLDLKQILSLRGFGKRKITTLILCMAKAAIDCRIQKRKVAILEKIPAAVNIRNILGGLKDKEKEIIVLRYGFFGNPVHTLEEIGGKFGVTRERIRQLEQKALDILSRPANMKLFKRYIAAKQDEMWEKLADENGVLDKSLSEKQIQNKIEGEFALSVYCCMGSAEKWLSEYACETDKAWYKTGYPEETIKELTDQLLNLERCLPASLKTISQEFHADKILIRLVIGLSDHLKQYKGYVLSAPLGARARRTVNLHRILSERFKNRTVSIYELVREHNNIFSDEACSERDAVIVMESASHLFVQIADIGWCSIGESGNIIQRETELLTDSENIDDQDDDHVENTEETETSIRLIIKRFFEIKGPCRLSEIVNYFNENDDIHYPANSIPFILSYSSEFTRLAPGLYGLWDKHADVPEDQLVSDLLLTDQACRLYVLARYSGELPGAYPFWNYLMEYKWCKWLEEKGDNPMLFESLLFIAEPQHWKIPDSEKEFWLSKKSQKAKYHFEAYLLSFSEKDVPDLIKLFALAKHAKNIGRMNWFLANRILNSTRISSQNSALSLAMLIGLGVLQPCTYWQASHRIDSGIHYFLEPLSQQLYRTGVLEWNNSAGLYVKEMLKKSAYEKGGGWPAQSCLLNIAGMLQNQSDEGMQADEISYKEEMFGSELPFAEKIESGHKRIRDSISVRKRRRTRIAL